MSHETLVSVLNVSKSFLPRGKMFRRPVGIQALGTVSLDIREGSVMALIGESGSGKSTLARCLALLLRPDSGVLRHNGRDLSDAGGRDLRSARRAYQYIPQDAGASLNPRWSAVRCIEEPLRVASNGPCSLASDAMEMVGLSGSLRGHLPHELSGGQKTHVAIARALVCRPRLLILDETLGSLDLSTRARMANLLLQLKQDLGLTYVVISHGVRFVASFADNYAVMREGRLIETGPAAALLAGLGGGYSRGLLRADRLFGFPVA